MKASRHKGRVSASAGADPSNFAHIQTNVDMCSPALVKCLWRTVLHSCTATKLLLGYAARAEVAFCKDEHTPRRTEGAAPPTKVKEHMVYKRCKQPYGHI